MQKYTVVSHSLYSLMAAILRIQQLSVAPLTCGCLRDVYLALFSFLFFGFISTRFSSPKTWCLNHFYAIGTQI